MKKLLLTLLLTTSILFAIVPPKNIKPTAKQMQLMDEIRKSYSEGFWAEKMKSRFETVKKYGNRSQEFLFPDTVFAPVLFGKYSDKTELHSVPAFQQLLFSGPNPTGTVTDFYKECSYNQLILTGECLGWYKVPRTQDYYVKDGGRNAGLTYGGRDFTIDLMIEADKTINYAKYVSKIDAEGAHVTLLATYHTGADAASGADNIWSHRWNIRDRLLTRKSQNDSLINKDRVLSNGKYITNDSLNGVRVIIDGDYCIQPELRGSNNSSGQMKPIGVLAHELGHIFGLPDLYDTDGTSGGIGNWCVMSGGSYGGDGSHEGTPAQFSAWCKEKLGWINPVNISSYIPSQPIQYVEKYPELYKFYPKGIVSGNEYFLVENRQKKGYDQYLPESGLLIWHIDNSISSNSNDSRRKVDLEQADGLRQLNTSTGRGDAGDPYPGSSGNKTFDGYSNPNSISYLNQQTYAGIRKISKSDTIMFASFDVGTRPYIVKINAELLEGDSSNSNGRVDAGEKGNLKLSIENIYPFSLTNSKIIITSPTTDMVIDTALIKISVGGLSIAESTYKNIVYVKPTATSGRKTLNISAESNEEVFRFTPTIMVGFPKFILLNADSLATENVGGRYENILKTFGTDGELVTLTGNLSSLSLKNRTVLVFFSGRKKSNIISEALGDSLIAFIKRGGNVFLSGQNIAEDFKQRNSTLSTRLIKSSFNANIMLGRTLYGIPSNGMGAILTQMTLGGYNATPNQTSPDELNVSEAAMPIFRWNDANTGGYGGVWYKDQTANGKLVFWSFGMEGIPDTVADGTVTSSKAFSTVMGWFNGLVSSPDFTKNNLIPGKIELLNNYPNPFNPTTTIKFGIPIQGNVRIKIYDLLGRLVTTIANEEYNAGFHSVTFDATQFASGSYIYKLEAGNKSITKKMVLMK